MSTIMSRHEQIYLSFHALGESLLRGSLSLTLDFTSGEIYLLALQGQMKGYSQRKTNYLPNSSDCSMQLRRRLNMAYGAKTHLGLELDIPSR